MSTVFLRRAAHSACVAFLLIGATASAYADTFWQGRRSGVWEHGIGPNGTSNWYSARPLTGQPAKVPAHDAVFARGAVRSAIQITKPDTFILNMWFAVDAPAYIFHIMENAALNITGTLINRAENTMPVLNVRRNSVLRVRNDARFISRGAAKSARIIVHKEGLMEFFETSRGGNAVLTNNGQVHFRADSTAGNMTIVNRFAQSLGPHVRFFGRSNGGTANFLLQDGTYLDFSQTLGDGNRRVTSGRILNFGSVNLGRNTLAVSGNYIQALNGATGSLSIDFSGGRFGRLLVTGVARLGGELNVDTPPAPGSYLIIRAEGGLSGRLELEASVNGRLDYFPNEVILRKF